jgi:proline racemase
MYTRDELAAGEEFLHESIVGSLFRARILEAVQIGEMDAVIPEVTGSAWMMGMHRFYYDACDPLREGYLLIPSMKEEAKEGLQNESV